MNNAESPAPSGPDSKRVNRRAWIQGLTRGLTPVVVDIGALQPRLATYMAAVGGRGHTAWLELSPIATDAIPAGLDRVTIRGQASGTPFEISARGIAPQREGAARVPLHGARVRVLEDHRDAPRMDDARDPLMIVIPEGAVDAEVHVFPLADLGVNGCSVESAFALEPGTRIDPVEIIGDWRVLRRGSAVVQETIPWCSPRGQRRFRSRLVLGETELDQAGRIYERVSEPSRVRRLLELATLLQVEGWFEAPVWGRGTCTFRRLGQAELTLEVGTDVQRVSTVPVHVRVGVEVFGISYEMDLRLLRRQGPNVELTLPLFLRERWRRRERRIRVPDHEDVTVRVRNPVTSRIVERRVLDVSYSGLAFEYDPSRDLVWDDLPMDDAEIHWRGRRIELGEICVRAVDMGKQGPPACHASIRDTDVPDDPHLVDLLASLGHPGLTADDGRDFDRLIEAYRHCHLIKGYMARNLAPVEPSAATNCRILRRDAPELGRTWVHETSQGIDATVTILRAWEHTWIAQHFGARSSDGFRWAGELQMALLDYMLPRPRGRFMCFTVEAANRVMNGFYERFFELTGSSESIERGALELWSLPADAANATVCGFGGRTWRPVRRVDEAMLARAAERAFGPMTARALSMVPGELHLPDTEAAYDRVALTRTRRCRLMTERAHPLFMLAHEHTSLGLNLTGQLNANWIVPIHWDEEREDELLGAALDAVAALPPPADGLDRFVMLPSGMSTTAFEERGWVRRMNLNTYVLNRSGLMRYYDYVAARYGRVGARAARRAQRTPEGHAREGGEPLARAQGRDR